MTYEQAFAEACSLAIQTQRDVGIEKLGKGFLVFLLRDPENRDGRELRCEVVTPLIALTRTWKKEQKT